MNHKHLIYALGLTLGLASTPSVVLAQTPDESKPTTVEQPAQDDLEQKLRGILKADGTPVFNDSAISSLKSRDIPLDYAFGLASIIEPSGERLINENIPWFDIYDAYEREVPLNYVKEIAGLTGRNGSGFFFGSIVDYFENGGTENFAMELISIRDKGGNPIFAGYEVEEYHATGGTIGSVKSLLELEDGHGKMIFDIGGSEITEFLTVGGTLDIARDLTGMKDIEGKSIFESGYELNSFLRAGGSVGQARELFSLKDKKGDPIFSGFGMGRFLEEKGTFDLAKKYSSIESPGERPFFRGLNMAMFESLGGSVAYARLFADLNNQEGIQIFNGSNIWDFTRHGGNLRYARDLINVRDQNGRPIFSNGFDMAWYHEQGGTIQYARDLASLTDDYGNPSLDQRHMSRIQEAGLTLDQVRSVHGVRDSVDDTMLDGLSIYRLAQLGLTPAEINFQDTSKPNAVIIYPTRDWNGAFESEEELALFQSIRGDYDVFVRLADQESDAYRAISRVPSVDLLILGGHGSEKSMSFGETDPLNEEPEKRDERYTLDLSDIELGQYLQGLNPNAVIFLNSCSNAKGGNGENIADFIGKLAGGRKVIAATEIFGAPDVTINQMHPFDVTIMGGLSDNRRDITYRIPN